MNARSSPFALLVLAFLAGGPAEAAPPAGGDYVLERSVLSGGGTSRSTGGTYRLGGSIGQADAVPYAGGVYRLRGGFWAGPQAALVDAGAVDPVPRAFATRIAGPNPFRASTSFAVDLPAGQRLELAVYGVDGRLVRRLLDADRGAGRHVVRWDGRDRSGRTVPPGIYLARIVAGPFRSSERLVRLD